MPIDALSVLCAQLTGGLMAIAKFLSIYSLLGSPTAGALKQVGYKNFAIFYRQNLVKMFDVNKTRMIKLVLIVKKIL